MHSTEMPSEMARRVLQSMMYMTIATADERARPWASPVWYAPQSSSELLWASDPDARHSRNIVRRPEIGVVVFDSTVPIGSAEAVYMEAVAEELRGPRLEQAVEAYSRRSQQVGAPAWKLADVTAPARFRLYRAVVSATYVLGSGDKRIAVSFEADAGPVNRISE
jgi:uncharacterized protein YhbP (UPF0306 family)